MIEIFGLNKIYENRVEALKKITARISKKRTAIIGRNGAGKTTLIRILSTQLMPTSGYALINGLNILKDEDEIRKKVSCIPQEARPVGLLTPYEHILIYLTARGYSFKNASEEARKALKQVNLWENRNTPADELSGGMKRKLFVAMALASNAELVFLDEPTTGLDPLSRLEVWTAIKGLSSELVLTTHYMEEAQSLAEELIFMESGTIIKQGTAEEVLSEFGGKVRIESRKPEEGWKRVGGLYINYVDADSAQEYIKLGYDVKQITLEDLFFKYGVEIES
ncbi:MAG: ABC transporter ATP-binding protein [Nitrososphaeria archaeon]|nr:ABC transporter ATP-binding protein [Conexivisphaerales archaeon]